MNVYELNKGMYATIPPMKEDDVRSVVMDYLESNRATYYLMLNHDIHYYTLFHIKKEWRASLISFEMLDIFNGLGDIVDIINNKDNGMLEVWIRQDDKILMFGLFNYERGVVEI